MCRGGRSAAWRGRLTQQGDRIEELAAIADRADTEISQVGGGQTRQDGRVDVVGAKCGPVPLQTQSLEPSTDVLAPVTQLRPPEFPRLSHRARPGTQDAVAKMRPRRPRAITPPYGNNTAERRQRQQRIAAGPREQSQWSFDVATKGTHGRFLARHDRTPGGPPPPSRTSRGCNRLGRRSRRSSAFRS